MLKNQLLIAFRNFHRNRSFTLINLLGLTLGVACSLVIFLFINYELSFDDFHSKKDRVYRVITGEPGNVTETGTPKGLHQVIEEEIPQVEEIAVIYRPNSVQLDVDGEIFQEKETYYGTPSFFTLFDYKWINGSPETSLSDPGQVVLTEAMAEKYFGGDALGKRLKLNNKRDLVVSGIIENMPSNTNFPIDILISFETCRTSEYYEEYIQGYSTYYETYVLLQEGVAESDVEKQFPYIVEKYLGKEVATKALAHELQPFSEIHYNNEVGGGGNFIGRATEMSTLRNIGLVGLFILLIAAVNFINLTTAQAVKRSKEVGIRKALGSNRKQLISQFLSEAFLLVILAVALSWVVVYTFRPLFADILDIELRQELLYSIPLLLFLTALSIILTFLSGAYPAFVLSKFRPLESLKNKMVGSPSSSGFSLRKTLVGFQFGISQFLILCTIVMLAQTYYFNNTDLGFDKEAVVTVDIPSNSKKVDQLRNSIASSSDIQEVSFSLNAPTATSNKYWNYYFHESNTEEFTLSEVKYIDENYLKMYDIELLAGRDVKAGDSAQVVINETLMNQLGFSQPDDVLGEQFRLSGEDVSVIGVVKDFHSLSLHAEIYPLIFTYEQENFQLASFKINMGNAKQALSHIENEYKKAFPEVFYSYKFLDEDIASQYKEEQKTSQLIIFFTFIAIAIGCLGMYGLISYITIQKTKEISIRKVLGARVDHIVYLLNKDFLTLFVIGFIIAAPVAYYLMDQWLSAFTFKVEITWWMFAISALFGLVITGITVSFKSLIAATTNPVDSLYSE